MARKNKLKRFQELEVLPNVYQAASDDLNVVRGSKGLIDMKGTWGKSHFDNDNPITLELACGKGEYTTSLAMKYPERNFIGIDIKGARLWKGAKRALDRNIRNAAFLRIRIEFIQHYFVFGEVSEIWITFPDPFLKKENRRLTAPSFIDRYRKICKTETIIHLKTDDDNLYQYSNEVIRQDAGITVLERSDDVHNSNLLIPDLETVTYYENSHINKNKKIKYISFSI